MSVQIDGYKAIAKTIASARIGEWQDSHNLSQVKIAAKIEISERSFRHYLQGCRQLPQSVRLKFINEFQFDPIPTDLIYQKLGVRTPEETQPEWPIPLNRRDFWKNLKSESKSFRKENYSRSAQTALQLRDDIYTAATLYFASKHVSLVLDVPFGFEVNGTDWVFVMSFVAILVLISSVLTELPLVKVTQHLLRR